MSIVARTASAFLLDSAAAIRRDCGREPIDQLFAVHRPYFATAAEADDERLEGGRKRKRRHTKQRELNSGEQAALDYHDAVSPRIISVLRDLMMQPQSIEFIDRIKQPQQSCDDDDSRAVVHILDQRQIDLAEQCALRKGVVVQHEPLVISDAALDVAQCINRLVVNPGPATSISVSGGRYCIPANSKYYLSDIASVGNFAASGMFDVLVMDPPWENKSATKRAGKYNSLPNHALFSIPLPRMLSEDGVVMVWVTNRQQHMAFIREHLFPRWRLIEIAEWHWVKITTDGRTVTNMDSPHRRPYETMIVGARAPMAGFPEHMVVASVPAVQHSRKPPLHDVIDAVLPSHARRAELFARCVTAGWSCWGNEVLKFQSTEYFQPTDSEEAK